LWKLKIIAAPSGAGSTIAAILLRILALGVPGRRRHVADAREERRAEVAQLPLRALHLVGGLEDGVDLGRVVVAGRDDAADGVRQSLAGQLAPALELGADLALEHLLAVGLVGAEPLDLGVLHLDGVEAEDVDVGDELLLLGGRERERVAAELR
jgi:hypothetical protein